jgi:hypothetical protein
MAEFALGNEKILADIKKGIADIKKILADAENPKSIIKGIYAVIRRDAAGMDGHTADIERILKIYKLVDKLYTKLINQYDCLNTNEYEYISPKMKYFHAGIYTVTSKFLTDDRKQFPTTMCQYKQIIYEEKYFDAGFYPDIKDDVEYKYFEAGIYKMKNMSDKIPIIYNDPMMSHNSAYFEAGYYPVNGSTNLKKYRLKQNKN